MEDLNRKQWQIFEITCAVIAFVLLVHVWILLPLYTDAALRTQVSTLVQAAATREGWLLSGVSIDHLSRDSVRLLYRSHLRGEDPMICSNLLLGSGELVPCTD